MLIIQERAHPANLPRVMGEPSDQKIFYSSFPCRTHGGSDAVDHTGLASNDPTRAKLLGCQLRLSLPLRAVYQPLYISTIYLETTAETGLICS